MRAGRVFRRGRPLALGLALGGAAALAGCLDTGLFADAAFAPQVAGLSPDQPWTALPVGSWLSDSRIEPVAVSACLAGCEVRAVVARFEARGPDAAILARLADDPAPLVRALSSRPSSANPSAAVRRAKPVPADRRAVASATPLRDGRYHGFLVHLARPDGSRPAYGAVLTQGKPDRLSVLLVVTDTEGAALRLAREVVAAGT